MSNYGNVPREDIEAMQNAVSTAYSIAASTPPNTAPEWRNLVYETVLEGILQDWVQNGTRSLQASDVEDITNLVKVAIDLSGAADPGLQTTTFHVLLKKVIQDWVANWNAEDE